MVLDVSVVVAVHDDAERVPALLTRLGPVVEAGGEVIVVDDGSTDGSGDLLRESSSPSMRLLELPRNVGVAEARTHGLAMASRSYVWFVDSDDDWPPEAAATLVRVAESSGADVVVAGARIEWPDGRSTGVDEVSCPVELDAAGAVGGMLEGWIHGYLWNKLFRRDLVASIDFPQQHAHSDFGFVFDALSRAGSVHCSPEMVYRHLVRGGSVSQAQRSAADLRRAARHAAASPAVAGRDHRELAYFEAWFQLVPASRIIVRGQGSARELAAAAREVRRRHLWAAVRRRDRPLVLRLLLLRVLGAPLPGAYLSLFRSVPRGRRR